jgi:hypothetical protein
MTFLFPLTTLLSAFLLFQIQPLIARVILPTFGGTPAVWTTCMLFFQALLVGGYGYGHVVATKLPPRRQALVHGIFVGASLLVLALATARWGSPLVPPAGARPDASHSPILGILGLLFVTVGVPYLVLSTTGPLVQSWARLANPTRSPYRLYALSNVGSLAGLLLYPTVVERLFGIRGQAWMFAALYLAFGVSVVLCGRVVAPVTPQQEAMVRDDSPPPSWRSYLAWIALAAVASTLLLSTTNVLCQDVAAIPLLWVVPLSLYLVSFILCFDRPAWDPRGLWMPLYAATAALAAYFLLNPFERIGQQIGVWCGLLFAGCMVCHGELARARPQPRWLTGFWFAVAVGGATGGLFVSLVAPHVLTGYYEVDVAIFAGGVVVAAALWKSAPAWLRVALPVALALLAWPLGKHVRNGGKDVVEVSRSFFGVLRVTEKDADKPETHRRMLTHGRIVHGFMLLTPDGAHTPCTYYEPGSGIGRAITMHPHRELGLSLGMCGLGTGTVAAYTKPGDTLKFYEIDPDVVALSRSEHPQFRYLADARGKVDVVLGDARISLSRELEQHPEGNRFDVLAIDAFSGDAIPVHLLTKEAVALYMMHLKPDGILAVHISNRHFRLYPVVRAIADSLGLAYTLVDTDYESKDIVHWDSTWVLVARDKATLEPYGSPDDPDDDDNFTIAPWTDESSNVMRLLKL